MPFRPNRLATRVTLIFFFCDCGVADRARRVLCVRPLPEPTREHGRAPERDRAACRDCDWRALGFPARAPARCHAPAPDLLRATPTEQRMLLDDLLVLNPSYLELTLLDGQGNVSATTARVGHHIESVEHDADRAAAFQAAQQGQSYLGHVYLAATPQEPYIVMGEPLAVLPERQRGALVAWINLRYIWDIVSAVRVGDSGYAYVLDADGNLIAYRDPAPILARQNPLRTNAGLRAHLLSTDTASEYTGLNGAADIGAHAPIESTHWVVVVETPLAEAYALLYRALAVLVVLLVVGIVVSAFLARYLATRLLDPVELLREGAALIGQGHLDHRIVIETGDEIEELAAEFNRMTQNLRRARTELEDWAREMERRVQQRTEQVIEQKERLAVLEALVSP